jgi:hypothetical protein
VRRLITARTVMLASLGVMWLNYALTSRWAQTPGSIHGPKEPLFVCLLILTTLLAVRSWPSARAPLGRVAHLVGWLGIVLLAGMFFVWFPPATWTQIPFLDNWPGRYQSTIEGIDLLWRGSFAGWQWHYLGGYHLSSDVTQSHTLLALIPVLLFGPAVGFHLLHLAMFLALPVLVFWDLSSEDDETRYVAAGLTAVVTTGFAYFLLRSGDTNSLAGVACTALALGASSAAARGARWGGPLLVVALVLLNYVHVGFFLYAVLFLMIEALFYRDRARLLRGLLAAACAFAAGLPQHWESWRYPDYFIPNNVVFERARFEWLPFLRKVFYNVELMWLPGRWFNDFSGLANVFLPVTAYVAWRVRSRSGFYAWIALVTLALLRLNTPEFAYLFLRPIHVLAICAGPVLAVFLSRYVGRRALAVSTIALVAVYLQILVFHVPHVRTSRDADPALVDRIATLDGALVLVENTPHRDMDADPARTTEPPPVQAHVEQLLAATTGKRLYAGLWDGWQWSPYRNQVLAGGAFKGRGISTVSTDEFTAELRKWGVRHLLVWSPASLAFLGADSQRFAERWASGPWHHFEYLGADSRDVVTTAGSGRLVAFDSLSGRVQLKGVPAGATVVVRTNYHPSWTASVDRELVSLFDSNGQLAFLSPKDGSYTVRLSYPRRAWLSLVALVAIVFGVWVGSRWRPLMAEDSSSDNTRGRV